MNTPFKCNFFKFRQEFFHHKRVWSEILAISSQCLTIDNGRQAGPPKGPPSSNSKNKNNNNCFQKVSYIRRNNWLWYHHGSITDYPPDHYIMHGPTLKFECQNGDKHFDLYTEQKFLFKIKYNQIKIHKWNWINEIEAVSSKTFEDEK